MEEEEEQSWALTAVPGTLIRNATRRLRLAVQGARGPRISIGHLRLVVDLGRLPVPKPPATWPGDNGQGGVTELWGLFALGQMFLVDPV
jgi:hypothetical protein